jgi:NAD(P)H-flavin reductase
LTKHSKITSFFYILYHSRYIGAKTPLHLPLQSRYEKWEKDFGVKVVPVLSQPNDAASADWKGATGYIQDQLK